MTPARSRTGSQPKFDDRIATQTILFDVGGDSLGQMPDTEEADLEAAASQEGS